MIDVFANLFHVLIGEVSLKGERNTREAYWEFKHEASSGFAIKGNKNTTRSVIRHRNSLQIFYTFRVLFTHQFVLST